MVEPARRDPFPAPLVLLVALLVARVAAGALPVGMVWGVASARDVAAPWGALLVGGMAAAVSFAAFGSWRAAPAAWLARGWPWLLAASGGALLVALPDRVRFVGDFVLRRGILDEGPGFLRIFPQALPLDAFVNHTLPARLALAFHTGPAELMRALAVAEGLALVALATRFARTVCTRESTACAVAVVIASGGYAALFSGYSKPTPQLVLAALAAATFGLELVTRGRGALAFALAVCAGLALHRGALPLALPWLVASVVAFRRPGAERRALWPLALPLVVLAWEAPRLAHVIGGFDAGVNFAPPEVAAQGGVLAAAFSPLRLLDVANALLLHAPLAPFAWFALRELKREIAARWLLVCFAAFVPVLLFVYLPLGPFRDWDALAPGGAMFALLAAYGLARALERAPRARELSIGAAASAAVPLLLLLVSLGDLERGFARAEALLAGPPARSATHRASVLDWLGLRALNEERFDVAQRAYRRLCADSPAPHALKLWGTAALINGDASEGERAFTQLTTRVPADAVGWYGLWMSAAVAGDTLTAERAAARARAWGPESAEMSTVVAFFDHYPRLYAILKQLSSER